MLCLYVYICLGTCVLRNTYIPTHPDNPTTISTQDIHQARLRHAQIMIKELPFRDLPFGLVLVVRALTMRGTQTPSGSLGACSS